MNTIRINIGKRAAKGLKTCAVAISLLTLVSTGTSFAFTTFDGYQDALPLKAKTVSLGPAFQNSPSSTVTDSCLPLLKSFQKTPSKSVIDRNQRSAGKLAALGLIFGVRYALTPPIGTPANKVETGESLNGSYDVWHQKGSSLTQNDRSAQAIGAYRACQKKQALAENGNFY
ncbi:MAG: hypothetical protein GW778_08840 [Alphaproteobacteria bacterium]|nr:hypothetical protein [Alphaproteobacteria bacterium]